MLRGYKPRRARISQYIILGNERMKSVNVLLFFGAFVVFTYCLSTYFGNNPKPYVQEIQGHFKGKLVKKYFLKVDHYVFKVNDREIDIVYLSRALIEKIEVGDSIVKIKNDNSVILVKSNGQRLSTSFIYLPISIRKDYRWPNEWKGKPKSWYGE